jgi:hypothetical protein
MISSEEIKSIPSILIAPCGMNCGICMAYLRDHNRCVGCNIDSPDKRKTRLNCKIRNCSERTEGSQFCFTCNQYPCARLRQLDKRYRTKYSMSMIDNLNAIRDFGLDRFMEIENTRWVCPKCGNSICVHNRKCYKCGKVTY